MTVYSKTVILLVFSIFCGIINSEPDDATVCADNHISMVFYMNHLMAIVGAYHVSVLVCGIEFHCAACPDLSDADHYYLDNDPNAYGNLYRLDVLDSEGKENNSLRKKEVDDLFGVGVFKFIGKALLEGKLHTDIKTYGDVKAKAAEQAQRKYDCRKYDITRNNCAHFARDFATSLTGKKAIAFYKWPAKLLTTITSSYIGKIFGAMGVKSVKA